MLAALVESIPEKNQQLYDILIHLKNEKEDVPAIITVLYNKKILIKLLNLKIHHAYKFSEITGGCSNETYHYRPDNLVLRFSRLGNPFHCNQSAEVRNLLQAKLFALTPLIVVGNYAKHHVLVTRFIPNYQIYSLDVFLSSSKLIALANLVKNLHYSQSYFKENSESAISFVDKLSPSFQTIKAILSKEDYSILEKLDVLRKTLEEFKIFKRPSHGDLHHFNLIEVDDAMQLIDWELSSIADPAYDIARLFSVDNFNVEQKEIFINAYKISFDIFLSEETIKHLILRIQLFEPLNYFSIAVWCKHTIQFCDSDKRKILEEVVTNYTKKTLAALSHIETHQDTVKRQGRKNECNYPNSYFSFYRRTHEHELFSKPALASLTSFSY